MKLTLGFSPCPNDTFIFDALTHNQVSLDGIEFDYVLEDVETLNRWALEGRLDVTKLSYNAFLHCVDRYALLLSGSALGRGVGPLLVAREPLDLARISDLRIAIPGASTTANLLLSLAFPQAKQKEEVLFSDIEAAVLGGRYDAGLIIHESRFTYMQKGLVKLMDLGDWWEQEMQAAIPLGGIVMRRSLGPELCARVDAAIRQSLALSWQRYPELSAFVTCHAQEMDEAVMRSHIELYVNEFTTDLGREGRHSIDMLFASARRAGLIPDRQQAVFY